MDAWFHFSELLCDVSITLLLVRVAVTSHRPEPARILYNRGNNALEAAFYALACWLKVGKWCKVHAVVLFVNNSLGSIAVSFEQESKRHAFTRVL